MRVTPNFHMSGNCKEAIQLYKKAFGARIQSIYCNSDANPQDYQARQEEEDFVYHAEINICGQRILMTDDLAVFPPKGNTLSLAITFDTADEVRKVFQVFSGKCQVISPIQSTTYSSCFVSFVDRFGVRWELMTEQTEC